MQKRSMPSSEQTVLQVQGMGPLWQELRTTTKAMRETNAHQRSKSKDDVPGHERGDQQTQARLGGNGDNAKGTDRRNTNNDETRKRGDTNSKNSQHANQ